MRAVSTSRLPRGSPFGSPVWYCVPGSVIAVGLIIPLAAFDNAVDSAMRAWFGVSTGLLLTGGLWL